MRLMAVAIAFGVALGATGVAQADDKVALRLPSANAVEGLSRSIATPLLKTRRRSASSSTTTSSLAIAPRRASTAPRSSPVRSR